MAGRKKSKGKKRSARRSSGGGGCTLKKCQQLAERRAKQAPAIQKRQLAAQIKKLQKIARKKGASGAVVVTPMGSFAGVSTKATSGYRKVAEATRAKARGFAAGWKARKAATKARLAKIREEGARLYSTYRPTVAVPRTGPAPTVVVTGGGRSTGNWPSVAVPRVSVPSGYKPGTWTSGDPGRRKKKRGAKKKARSSRDASYRDHDMRDRDWEGQPIRHARASVLGWQRRFKKKHTKGPSNREDWGKPKKDGGVFGGQRRPVLFHPANRDMRDRDWEGQPIRHARASVLGWQRRFKKKHKKGPSNREAWGQPKKQGGVFGGQRRPVLFHPVKRDAASYRDWPGESKRHSYAAAYGWQKRFRKNKDEFPGRRPEREFFRGSRPVKSTLQVWPPPKRRSGRRDYAHRVY